jgi:hypothetical protein
MRRIIAVIAAAATIGIAVPATSSAGGWVVVSLDSTPVVDADRDTTVGFTVLRHGVTPESSDDLSIVLTGDDGVAHRFAAVQQGAVGHHVATIRVESAGSYDWWVTSGSGFVQAELGTLTVSESASGGAGWAWDVVQWGSASVALLMGALAFADHRRTRTRDSTAPATA